ncbi:unnamed protein product [Prorocentrum cordatum]|uniref:Photosystem II reaction center protein T n=1 Tax=Prorocentrum cordatum TaxID=2364126 RepID=A0ABN9RIH4_9DINO|nr:unnamed protein product [Polarella glacialis]
MARSSSSPLVAIMLCAAMLWGGSHTFVPQPAQQSAAAAGGVMAGLSFWQLPALAAQGQDAIGGSSVAVAGGEEALFYVGIIFITLITLVLAVVLREPPRV